MINGRNGFYWQNKGDPLIHLNIDRRTDWHFTLWNRFSVFESFFHAMNWKMFILEFRTLLVSQYFYIWNALEELKWCDTNKASRVIRLWWFISQNCSNRTYEIYFTLIFGLEGKWWMLLTSLAFSFLRIKIKEGTENSIYSFLG